MLESQPLGCTGVAARGPVLVVESDPHTSRFVDQLVLDGYEVALARTAEHARTLARLHKPSLAILCGLGSPRGTLDLLTEIRAGIEPWEASSLVVVVGPGSTELDMLRAFESGADDFLAMPLHYVELRVRLRALLRRAERAGDAPELRVGALSIDTATRVVAVDGLAVSLRRLEFELLCHLARAPQRVFSCEELLRVVWGDRARCATRTIDSHASRLRRKLIDAGNGPCVINVRGVGYRLI